MTKPAVFDTRTLLNKLEETGVPRSQANAQVDVVLELVNATVATKEDVQLLSQEIQEVDNKFTQQIIQLSGKFDIMDLKILAVDTKVRALETRVTAIESKLGEIDVKIGVMDVKIVAIHEKLDKMERSFGEKLDKMEGSFDEKLDKMGRSFGEKLEKMQTVLIGIMHQTVAQAQKETMLTIKTWFVGAGIALLGILFAMLKTTLFGGVLS